MKTYALIMMEQVLEYGLCHFFILKDEFSEVIKSLKGEMQDNDINFIYMVDKSYVETTDCVLLKMAIV